MKFRGKHEMRTIFCLKHFVARDYLADYMRL
jgi:hypothetical protein